MRRSVAVRRALPTSPFKARIEAPRKHFAVGDRVTHDSFGLGTVLAVEGVGTKAVAKIDFGGDGTKRLLLRFAPVTKL